jgi:hypothetical protein
LYDAVSSWKNSTRQNIIAKEMGFFGRKQARIMAKREYFAYLLRFWRENRDGDWRVLLENPNAEERIGFANLADLIEFLEDKTGEALAQNRSGEAERKP